MVTNKVLPIVVALAAMGFAQIQTIGNLGTVDWGSRSVTAVGIGAPNPNMPEATYRPMAIQAARNVALRNALELIKGLQMTSSTTVENFMVTSDVIRTSVDGYIRKFTTSEPRFMSDKTIEVTVTIPLDAELASTILPPTVTANPTAVVVSPVSTQSVANFSGLVIDARGTGAIPALIPKIVDEDGKEVYGSAYVSREWAVKWGMAGYAKTPEQAATFKDRIGAQPGMIKAVRATGASRCDIVISNRDAMNVRAAAKASKFFSDCRVIIVVD